MTYFRNWRGWVAAFALLPVAAFMIGTAAGAGPRRREPDGTATPRATSDRSVHPNEKVTVRGRFRPLRPQSALDGADRHTPSRPRSRSGSSSARSAPKHWQAARRTRAGKAGRFRERLAIERSGRVRAVSADGRTTGARKIRVRTRSPGPASRSAPRSARRSPIKGRVAPGGDEAQGDGQGRRRQAPRPPNRQGRVRGEVEAAVGRATARSASARPAT